VAGLQFNKIVGTCNDMKKIFVVLGLSCLIISACMVYLIRSGVGLRLAPLIKPTVMKPDLSNVAADVVLRLYPEFQTADYVVWGLLPETPQSEQLFSLIAEEYQKTFPFSVNVIRDAEAATDQELQACAKPCWLMIARDKANELTEKSFLEKRLKPLGKPYFNMSWIDFTKADKVSELCNKEQRLTLDCVGPVAVRDVRKKLKEESAPYFFLRKYNDNDYFLFIEKM